MTWMVSLTQSYEMTLEYAVLYSQQGGVVVVVNSGSLHQERIGSDLRHIILERETHFYVVFSPIASFTSLKY